MDGLKGPLFTGTGYYLKRKALYGTPNQEGAFLHEPKKTFGLSSKFIASLKDINDQDINGKEFTLDVIVEEAMILAGCTFEKGTKWGKEIGYTYDSLLESTFTGYLLHCKGWRSVYLYPKRPCFLGCTIIDMKDAMIQIMKWCSGLFQVAFSRFSPLTDGMSKMSILQSMCYGSITFAPLHSISFLIYGTIPQLCFFSGIPLYPKGFKPMVCGVCNCICVVTLPTFIRGPLYRWLIKDMWNEQRIWIIRCVTSYLFGCLDVLLKRLGITKANFRLTNKAIDQEKLQKYEKGKFDFQGAEMFMVPLGILSMLNIVCFIGGMKRVYFEGNLEELFGQVFISSLTLVLSYPILEDLVTKKAK
ncbi:unnamed protein product [Camellia sinensis]